MLRNGFDLKCSSCRVYGRERFVGMGMLGFIRYVRLVGLLEFYVLGGFRGRIVFYGC